MEIKTIEQIMHEVANELKYKDWNVLRQCHAYKLSNYDAIWKTVIERYSSQFQTNTDLITTELCVRNERIAELEEVLGRCLLQFKHQAEQGRYPELFLQENGGNGLGEIQSLINKGKDND